MTFNSRSDFIKASASEKITIAHVEGRQRVLPWTLYGSGIYYADVSNWVIDVYNGLIHLSQAASIVGLSNNQWFYEYNTNKLYVKIGSDPTDSEIIATYRFFFSTAPLQLPYNLLNSGNHANYEARIQLAPPYKHSIGVDQNLVSIVGNGSLKLINDDGGLDNVYENIIFDNQKVQIYSWHRDLNIEDKKIIYRGKITDKSYTSSSVSFRVKDELIDLNQDIPQDIYTESDNVNKSTLGHLKRWVYGKVDGLKLQSIDQIASGYQLTGTVTVAIESTTLTGSGTSFLSQLSPGDRITIGTQEFTIDAIASNTSATLTNAPEFTVVSSIATVVPDVSVTFKNREFFVADHESAELTKTVVSALQLNRITLNNVDGLNPGDFVTFESGERIEIENLAFGNTIVLRQNLITLPLAGEDVVRKPVQQVFIEGQLVPPSYYTITNSTTTQLTLDSDAEFQLARPEVLGFSATFTNGSRNVTTADDVNLTEILKPRDWIKPSSLSYTTYYEILSVSEQSLELRIAFAQTTHTGATTGKKPNYVGDSTIVSANVLGRTENGNLDGVWIQTAAQVMKDLLTVAGLTEINTTSFTEGSQTNAQLVSIALPFTPGQNLTKYKDVIDKLARSTNSVITLDNDLKLKYKAINAEFDASPVEINDSDVINWEISSTSGKNIRNSIVRYRNQDVIRTTLESGAEVVNFSSDFVEKYVGTNKTEELNIYLYNTKDASIFSHRLVYNQSLARADISIESNLSLENIEIGDVVILNFARLYKRFGDSSSKKKAGMVVGKEVNGQRTKLTITDYGNIFNRSSIITPDTAPDYSAATEDEKIKYGYITDAQGIIDDDANTIGIHLIS